jgi:uracil-DNA glycosylase
LNDENKIKKIYPNKQDLFNALRYTDYENVNVVILGQDPYHGEGEANGLCFSVNTNIKTPPSLKNIFKELKSDLDIDRTNTDLSDWAKQGVLLLNTVLTVEKDKPLSHRNKGWETFTNSIISKLNDSTHQIIFVLWGNSAREKKALITNNIHKVIESTHPSPFSYEKGFKGSKPFSKINKYLKENDKSQIIW